MLFLLEEFFHIDFRNLYKNLFDFIKGKIDYITKDATKYNGIISDIENKIKSSNKNSEDIRIIKESIRKLG